MMNKTLKAIYYNVKNPAFFSTAQKLYKAARLEDPSVTLKDVREWLKGEFTYTLHEPVRHKYKRNKVLVSAIDEHWQADLVDMQEFTANNNVFIYILTAIDVFLKHAYAIPLKTKLSVSVKNAFANIFRIVSQANYKQIKVRSSLATSLKSFKSSQNVQFFASNSDDIKCSVIERL